MEAVLQDNFKLPGTSFHPHKSHSLALHYSTIQDKKTL